MIRRSCLVALTLLGLSPMTVYPQQAATDFRQQCVSCHTIGGGRLTGPDLKDVGQRRDREWLLRFIRNPKAVIDSGDAYALQLYEDSRRVMMPVVAGMTEDRATALLDLIDAESELPESQFKGLEISDRPFTDRDVAAGRALFLGHRDSADGATACLSCHTVRSIGGLGGGRLGPDLTRAYERLGGRMNMGAWLFAPATPTMAPLFRDNALDADEILALLAFFEDASKKGGEDDTVALLNFFFLALGGLIFLLAVFDAIWKKRFRSVRALLVERRSTVRVTK